MTDFLLFIGPWKTLTYGLVFGFVIGSLFTIWLSGLKPPPQSAPHSRALEQDVPMPNKYTEEICRRADEEVQKTIQAFRSAVARLNPELTEREIDEMVSQALKEPRQS